MRFPAPSFLLVLVASCGGTAVVEREGEASSATTSAGAGPTREPGPCDASGNCGAVASGCIGCAIATECAAAYDACAGDEACVAYSDCMGACAGPDCGDTCEGDVPGGRAPYEALIACMLCQACYFDCGGASFGCDGP